MAKNTEHKVELNAVEKRFGTNHVLRDINLTVAPGESHVIIGGSGSGKSVMLKCILGLMNPSSGSIKIDGEETAHLSLTRRDHLMQKFGMLFQGGALFDSLPVWKNVTFGLLQRGEIKVSEARDLAAEKLASVGLGASVIDQFPAELSGGMQKRVALARAIAATPEIIFFDEPTTGLDPIMADVINDLIVKCVKELGATAITITHDMASARKIADRISMLYQGELIWTGDIKKLDKSGNDHVEQFIHGRAQGPIDSTLSHK